MLAFFLGPAQHLPGNSQGGLASYKRGVWSLLTLLFSLPFYLSECFFPLFLSPPLLCPIVPGWPLLLPFSLPVCLYSTPLPMSINKLYSIQYLSCGWYLMGKGWVPQRHSSHPPYLALQNTSWLSPLNKTQHQGLPEHCFTSPLSGKTVVPHLRPGVPGGH